MSIWEHHGKEGITMRLKTVGLVVMLALAILMVLLTVDAQPPAVARDARRRPRAGRTTAPS